MAKRRSNKCKLCHIKRKNWEDGDFFGVNCRNHFVPMIVLNKHENELSSEQLETVKELAKKYHPRKKISYSIRDSEDHWHVHLT